MRLSILDRGYLEKTIDNEIAQIPFQVRRCRDPQTKTKFQLKEPDDFVFGVVFGSIISDFTTYYAMANGRPITQDEINEAISVLDNRIAEIRNAIFNCG